MLSFSTVLGLVVSGCIFLLLSIIILVVYICYGREKRRKNRSNGFRTTRHFSGYMRSDSHEFSNKANEKKASSDGDDGPMYAQVTLPKIKRAKHEDNLHKAPENGKIEMHDINLDDDEDAKRPTSMVDDEKQILSVQDLLRNNKQPDSWSATEHENEENNFSHYSEEYPEDRYSTKDTESNRSTPSRTRSTPRSSGSLPRANSSTPTGSLSRTNGSKDGTLRSHDRLITSV